MIQASHVGLFEHSNFHNSATGILRVLLVCLCCGIPAGSAHAQAPVLLFSDVTSAPNTGWNNSKKKGAAISVWGLNFGDERGQSFISVNGAKATAYATWGERWPTPHYQRITFWLNSQMKRGTGQITVTVDGKTSNPLEFTIREGRIFFVTGNDRGGRGTGTLKYPLDLYGADNKRRDGLAEFGKLRHGIGAGDILYFRGGIYTERSYQQGDFILRLDGKELTDPHRPLALIAFPGEKPLVQDLYFNDRGPGVGFGLGSNTVVSGFSFNTVETAISAKGNNVRVIGNDTVGVQKASRQGTGIITSGSPTGTGSRNIILGNSIHGGRGGYRLDHAIYIKGCASDGGQVVAWNHVFDNDFGRGPLISVNHMDDRRLRPPNRCKDGQVMDGHLIFSNRVDCKLQRATAVGIYDLSYKPGEPEPEPTVVFNNIFHRCGTYEHDKKRNIREAFAATLENGSGHFYHNTWFDTGFRALLIGNDKSRGRLDAIFKNNIFHMNPAAGTKDVGYLTFSTNPRGTPAKFDRVVIEGNVFVGAQDRTSCERDGCIADRNNEYLKNGTEVFANEAEGDVRLSINSAAKDAGELVSLPHNIGFKPAWVRLDRDIDFRPRSGRVDAGAIER